MKKQSSRRLHCDEHRTVPDFIKHRFALERQARALPCEFCYNNDGMPLVQISDGINVVKEFDQFLVRDKLDRGEKVCDADVIRCMAGKDRPDGIGECSKFYPIAVEYRNPITKSLLEVFETDFFMEVIYTVFQHPGISITAVIDRQRSGYATRTKRIVELIKKGYLRKSSNIDCEATLYPTDKAEAIANAVKYLSDAILLCDEEGNLFRYGNQSWYLDVYEYIRENTWCTRRNIYDHYAQCDFEIEKVVDDLEAYGYIDGTYASDWKTIKYETSYKGAREYLAYKERSEGYDGCEE